MNSIHSRKFSVNFSRSRRALVQPRFLLAMTAMASAVGGVSYLATAQTGRAPVKMTAPAPKFSPTARLEELTQRVKNAGASGRLSVPQAQTLATGRAAKAVVVTNGSGQVTSVSGFNLTDVDLTPNSPSDEREPQFSPSGELIVFRSNGRDGDNDGRIDSFNAERRYHIWVMNSNGGTQRQLTGLSGADVNRDQKRPSWSPDGSQVVYVDENVDANGSDQLFTANALEGSAPSPSRITFFPGKKVSPAWAPNGLAIAFASNANPQGGAALGQFDIFSIDPGGDGATAQRLTGGTADPGGDSVDDLNPAYSIVDGNTLYFSSNRDNKGNPGRRIWVRGRAIDAQGRATGAVEVRQVTDPTQRTGFKAADANANTPADVVNDDFPTLSRARNFAGSGANGNVTEQLAFQTNNRLNRSDLNMDLNIWGLPVSRLIQPARAANPNTVPPTPATPAMSITEPAGAAFILTNALSSPATAQPNVANGGEDFAPDQEPSYGRSIASTQNIGTLAFASQRTVNPNPSATRQNDSGGNGMGATNDIFTTGTVDTTPPSLVPQQGFPVAAPLATLAGQGQGNPRTFEAGLVPGSTPGTAGSLKIAVVLDERESGLALNGNVFAVIRDANRVITSPTSVDPFLSFDPSNNNVDEEVNVTLAAETGNEIVSFEPLRAVDNGTGERQSGAVAGDGIYYCSTDVTTPAAGEYYIDIFVQDQKGNSFTYDNIWGFSTTPFAKSGTDLLVSDYAVGQLFPNRLAGNAGSNREGGDDGRFAAMFPVESYLIRANGQDGTLGVGTLPPPPPTDFGFGPTQSSPNAFPSADVWRILCRGPVTLALLNSYKPGVTTQIDPNETLAAGAAPFTARGRRVFVAGASVTWASPYTGTVFAGPGTLVDSATQNLLTDFSNAGGRLFVMGRDVGFGLTQGGTVESTFMKDILGADWGGDIVTDSDGIRANQNRSPGVLINHETGGFIRSELSYANRTTPALQDLEVPYHFDGKDFGKHTDSWLDAALNLNPNTTSTTASDGAGVVFPNQAVGVQPDELIPSSSAGVTTIPSYTILGRRVAQRVTRVINNGEARSVIFGFGLEAVNRRYRKPTREFGRVALDARFFVVRGVNSFLKTGSITGSVRAVGTGLPIANFLVRLSGNAQTVFLARTDANGNYTITGVSEGVYTVDAPRLDRNNKLLPTNAPANVGVTSPGDFFSGTPRLQVQVVGGANTPGVNLSPIPILPGTLRGRVVITDPNDATKQIPANEIYVLVRQIQKPQTFAAVAKTDANGNFSISRVPALRDLEVVLNPALTEIPVESGVRNNFTAPTFTGRFQNPDFAALFISGTRRPGAVKSTPVAGLQLASGGTFVLNNADTDTAGVDDNSPLPLPRALFTLNGKVTVNGIGTRDISVSLLNSMGGSLSPARTTVTDVNGNYSFTNVPVGSYVVKAVTRLRATASVTQKVENNPNLIGKPVLVPPINIVAPVLSGKVVLKTIGVSTRLTTLSGATVELLDANGRAFSPAITTTTNSSGAYIFNVVLNGTYRVRASVFLGSSTSPSAVSAAVKVTANTRIPDLTITRYQISGTVLKSKDNGGGVQPRAIVELSQGDNTLRSVTANADGTFVFANLLPGNYTVRAFASVLPGSATGSATVSIVATADKVPSTTITLDGTSNGPSPTPTPPPGGNGNGTDGGGTVGRTFAANSSGLISLPYAVDNIQGTLTVNQAFGTTYDPKNVGAYKLYRFNAAQQVNNPVKGKDFVLIDSGAFELRRGQGYLLETGNTAVSLQTPSQNPLLKSFAGTTFSIPLFWNATYLSDTSNRDNRENGYNLIGFPFNPSQFSTVAFAGSQVKYGNTTYNTIEEATAAGIIARQIYGIDAAGNRFAIDFGDRNIRSFQGYFVRILRRDQQVSLILRNPT